MHCRKQTVQCGEPTTCQSFSRRNHFFRRVFHIFLYTFTPGTSPAWINALHALLSAARPWVWSRTPRSSTHGNPRPWFPWLGKATKSWRLGGADSKYVSYTYICIHTYVYICVCMYVCMYCVVWYCIVL